MAWHSPFQIHTHEIFSMTVQYTNKGPKHGYILKYKILHCLTCAFLTPVRKCASPLGWTLCKHVKTLPTSVVNVTNTSRLEKHIWTFFIISQNSIPLPPSPSKFHEFKYHFERGFVHFAITKTKYVCSINLIVCWK